MARQSRQQRQSPAQRKIARLEDEIASKQATITHWNEDWHNSQREVLDLRQKLKGAEHQIENQSRQLEINSSRLAVLQSDRDRLTAAIEVMARRHASPQAEHDRTRAGWRHGVANYEQSTRRERSSNERSSNQSTNGNDNSSTDEAPRT